MRRVRRRGCSRPGLRTALRIAGGVASLVLAAVVLFVATLPDTSRLRKENPGETAFMRRWVTEQAARGRKVRPRQAWVPLARIAKPLQRAVVIAEDHSFFLHEGFDWDEMQKSLDKDLDKGRIVRGGSTITMQTAKNLYLSPSRNPLRKLREMCIAWKMERDLPKKRILEIYLNVIEWGEGIYGAEAAARTYYGKGASEIGEDEAAWLAATIPGPRHSNPARVTRGLRFRHNLILHRMQRYRVEGID